MIQIRSYEPSHYAAVIKIFRDGLMYYANQPGQVEHEWVDHIDACIHDDLAHIDSVYFQSGGHFWVAIDSSEGEHQDAVVGIVGLEKKSASEFELRRLSVHQDYRRHGVARLLVTHLEQWASTHGARTVWLSSGSPMTLAHAFYKSMGYQHVKTESFSTVEMLFFEKRFE